MPIGHFDQQAARPKQPACLRASRYLLATAIAGSALAVGTVHTLTLCIVCIVLAASAVLGWWQSEPLRARVVATVLLGTGLLLTAYTALQCVPLPMTLLSALAPYNAAVWSRVLSPLDAAGPSWAPLSLDPVGTRLEVLKGVTYLLAFVATLRIAQQREGVAFITATVIGTAVILSIAALLHPAFGAHKLYGLYQPNFDPGRHVAPLLNANNLAGYLNVGLCLALAAALAREPLMPRPLMAAAVLLLAATQLWIASRGGVLTMVLGVLVIVAIARITRKRGPRNEVSLSLASGIVVAAGVVLLVLGSSQQASAELLVTETSKLDIILSAIRHMLPSVPFFGCGRGAFATAFPAFRTDAGYVSYVYPEDFVAQWCLEWGLPIALLGFAAIVYALRPTSVLARSTTACGAWAALIALAVQNLADLSSEIPGVMVGAVVCAAIVVSGSRGERVGSSLGRWADRPRHVAVAAAIAAIAALVPALVTLGTSLDEDQRDLRDAALVRHVSAADMHELARAAMLRHPAEPYFPFVTALRAALVRDDNPVPWIGATLERASVYGPAHLVLARLIARRSPSQARLEYRLAIEQAPELADMIMQEAPRLVGGYYDAREVVPQGKPAIPVLERLVPAVLDRLPATAVLLDSDLRALDPDDPGPVRRAATYAIEDVEAGNEAPWCQGDARSSCLRDALEKAARMQRIAPAMCDGYALHARARIAGGDVAGALTEFSQAIGNVNDRIGCLQQLVHVARAAGSEAQAQAALLEIANAGCDEDAECANNLRWAAEQEVEMGDTRTALAFYRRACERSPDDPTLLEQTAALASRLGLHAEAAGLYEQLEKKDAKSARWHAAIDAERNAAIREANTL